MSRVAPTVRIIDNGVQLKNPTVIVGIPDMGLVGTIASSYLVQQLRMEEVGHVESEFMPPVMVVHKSVPSNPVHLFEKDDTVVVLSEVPLPARLAAGLTKELARWSAEHHATLVLGVTGLPSKEREESQAEKEPVVLGIGSDDKSRGFLKPMGVKPFEEGAISGVYASLLKNCMDVEQSCVIVLAESLISFPDPAAAAAAVQIIAKRIGAKVDVQPLLAESEEIRLRTRELINQTQQMNQQEQQQQQQQTAMPEIYK